MEVQLKPELQEYVDAQIREGRFSCSTEVLEAGLARLMLDSCPDALDAEDLAALEESEKQIARGEDIDWKQVRTDLERQYLRR